MDTESPAPTEPQKPVVKEKIKSRPAVVVLSVLLIIALAALGFAGYSWYQNHRKATDLQNELSRTKEALASANSNDVAEAQGEKEAKISDKGQRSSAASAAREFYCETANSDCDRSNATVTKIRLADVSEVPYKPGFAIVNVSSQDGGAAKFYVKSTDGEKWVVIFDGQSTPPSDIVEKFAIPSDFAG